MSSSASSSGGMKELVDGFPGTLHKPGRRFLMEGNLDRLINRTHKTAYYVYLFNDIIMYAEKKKKGHHKYVSHKYLANCLFVDYADSSKASRSERDITNVSKLKFLRNDRKDFCLKYAFEIKNTEIRKPGETNQDKEEFIFLAKNLDQKNLWKRDIEQQINDALDEEGVVFDSNRSPSLFGTYISGFNEDDTTFGSAGSSSGLTSEPDDIASTTPSETSSVSSTPGSEASSMASVPPTLEVWAASASSDQWSASADESACEDLDDLEINGESEMSDAIAVFGTAEDGSQVVQAASVTFVVWSLVYGDHIETSLIQSFLFMYRAFVGASELFDILKEIYQRNIPPKKLPMKYSPQDTKKKVAGFLKIWISKFFTEDFEKKTIFNKLVELLNEMSVEPGCRRPANDIKMAILRASKERIIKRTERKKKSFQLSQRALTTDNIASGSPTGPSSNVMGNKFMEFNLHAVAAHLTYLEHSMFQQVGLQEFAKMAWKDSRNSKKLAPNILQYTAKFNYHAQWVCTEIVEGTSPKQRALIIERFVSLANKCVEMNNFHSLMEILAGINRGHVDRLKKSWSLVSSSTMDSFNQLNELMDPRQNFKNYREALRKSPSPCLPYFGIFLQDIVFTEEGNRDKAGDLVNMEKVALLARIYKDVMYYQRAKYPSCDDETIQTYFKHLWVMPDEVLHHHSRAAEPSARKEPIIE